MRKILASALLTLSTSLLNGATTCDWPSVNHDQENTRSNPCENQINVNNVNTLTPLWTTVGTSGATSVQVAAVVVDNIVYYGDLAGNFYAKNVTNGADVYASVNLGAPVVAPATVTSDTIYVVTGAATVGSPEFPQLHALNLDLTRKTTFNGGLPVSVDDTAPPNETNVLAGPVIADNLVILPTVQANGISTTDITPSVHGTVNAFNATTGALVWRTTLNPPPFGASGASFSTAAVDTKLKLIFIGTDNAAFEPAGPNTDSLVAINYLTGEIKWRQQYTKDDVWGAVYPCGLDYDIGASPNLFTIMRRGKKIDVVGAASKEGIYRVFERANGNLVWETSVMPSGAKPLATAAPGAAYANGTIYVPTLFDTSGLRLSVLIILGTNGNVAAINAFGGSITTTNTTAITALDAATGTIKWQTTSQSLTSGSLTEANGVIYHNNWLGQVRALDAATGNVLFLNTPAPIFHGAPVTVVGGKVFVTSGISATGPGGITVYSLP